MPAPLLIGLAVGLATLTAMARLRWALALVVGTTLLIPASLVVPNGFTFLPTFHRVVLAALLFNLTLRAVRNREVRAALRPTPIHAAFGVLLLVAIVSIGIALEPAPLLPGLVGALKLVEQFLFFVAVFATIRLLPDTEQTLRIVAGVTAAMVAIVVIEHFTGSSWGAWWFADVPAQQAADAAQPLGTRGTGWRARAGSEFALQAAWVLAALLPASVLAVARSRAGWLGGGLLLVAGGAAVMWTFTRSATAAFGFVFAAGAFLAGRRTLGVLAGAGSVAVAAIVVLNPEVLGNLAPSVDLGAIAVRSERLPAILGLAEQRPLLGLGLGGLSARGFTVTDASYVLLYAELGMIGVAVFLALLATAVVSVARGVGRNWISGVTLSGMGAMVLAGAVFDAFQVLQSAQVMWLLTAVGLVATERATGPIPWPKPAEWRLAVVPATLLSGALIAWTAPQHAAALYTYHTIPAAAEAKYGFDPVVPTGRTLAGTVCEFADAQAAPGIEVECHFKDVVPAGVGQFRVEASTPAEVHQTARRIESVVRVSGGFDGFELHVVEPPTVGTATVARTAPVWMSVFAGSVALFVPPLRRRVGLDAQGRREGGQPDAG